MRRHVQEEHDILVRKRDAFMKDAEKEKNVPAASIQGCRKFAPVQVTSLEYMLNKAHQYGWAMPGAVELQKKRDAFGTDGKKLSKTRGRKRSLESTSSDEPQEPRRKRARKAAPASEPQQQLYEQPAVDPPGQFPPSGFQLESHQPSQDASFDNTLAYPSAPEQQQIGMTDLAPAPFSEAMMLLGSLQMDFSALPPEQFNQLSSQVMSNGQVDVPGLDDNSNPQEPGLPTWDEGDAAFLQQHPNFIELMQNNLHQNDIGTSQQPIFAESQQYSGEFQEPVPFDPALQGVSVKGISMPQQEVSAESQQFSGEFWEPLPFDPAPQGASANDISMPQQVVFR